MDKDEEKTIRAIGKRFKELRIKAGYSSHETFANDHGISRRNYWRLESGGDFKIKTLMKIIAIHKISLEEFFKGF